MHYSSKERNYLCIYIYLYVWIFETYHLCPETHRCNVFCVDLGTSNAKYTCVNKVRANYKYAGTKMSLGMSKYCLIKESSTASRHY